MGGTYDFCVIGGGIAGVAVASELARRGRVVLLEREADLGYHATGRSAALFAESYGNAPVRALTRASRWFFVDPPEGFGRPLVTARGALFVATAAQRAALETLAAALQAEGAAARRIDAVELPAIVPVLATAEQGILDSGALDIDVASLLAGFARRARAAGAEILTRREVTAIRRDGMFTVECGGERFSAPVVVNAAGAWAGVIGERAGALPLPLQPLRRTAFIIDGPPGLHLNAWPMVIDVEEKLYFKPDADRLLVSPADETPSRPCDAWADDLDVAMAVERLETLTTLRVERVASSWAGLRTFAPDRVPVVGFDPTLAGFFWLAGQGGYGVQTAPALARTAAALAAGEPLPDEVAAEGVTAAMLSPARFANA